MMAKFLALTLSMAVLLSGCASNGGSISTETADTESQSPSSTSDSADNESQSQSSTEAPDETQVDSEYLPNEDEEVSTDQQPRGPQVTLIDFEAAIDAADVEYDEFDEKTSFTVTPEIEVVDGGFTYFSMTLYLSSDGSMKTNFNTAYYNEDWLFFEFLDIRFQDETHEIYQAQSYNKYTEVVNGGYVMETFIHEPSTKQIDLFEELANEGSAKFRLLGDGGSVEREFTPSELRGFRTIITIYRGLEQGLNYEN